MKEERLECGCLFITLGVLAFILGSFVTFSAEPGREKVYREAAEAGAGQYVTDPLTGETSFEWGCE